MDRDEIEFIYRDAAHHIPDSSLADLYEDVHNLHVYFDALAYEDESNLILTGPKGIAKSLSVAAWAARASTPIITFNCSANDRDAQLIGHYILRGDETPFVLGPIPTAFKVANEHGRAVLLLEEINALDPSAQKLLNRSTDFHRDVEVSDAGVTLSLDEGCKLWIVATMNTAVYGGVFALNEDLKSRFNILNVGYPSLDQESQILKRRLKAVLETTKPSIVKSALNLALETRSDKSFAYALSTRDLVQFLTNVRRLGVERALRLLKGKFEDRDESLFKRRALSAFGVEL